MTPIQRLQLANTDVDVPGVDPAQAKLLLQMTSAAVRGLIKEAPPSLFTPGPREFLHHVNMALSIVERVRDCLANQVASTIHQDLALDILAQTKTLLNIVRVGVEDVATADYECSLANLRLASGVPCAGRPLNWDSRPDEQAAKDFLVSNWKVVVVDLLKGPDRQAPAVDHEAVRVMRRWMTLNEAARATSFPVNGPASPSLTR